MAKISNVQVYGLAESIYRSGYPMMDHAPDRNEFELAVARIRNSIDGGLDNPHIQRAVKLANATGGGHDQFLTGIVVQFDLALTNKAWVEAERYRFLNFVSSMSTMHRAAVLPIKECSSGYVSPVVLQEAERLQKAYLAIDGAAHPTQKKEAYLALLYNLPAGFELTAGMTTNYRCLKNIYWQRRDHRLHEWHIVCDWIRTLPLAEKLICGGGHV